MSNIPSEMKAIQLDRYEIDPIKAIQSLHVVKKQIPILNPGMVLIKVEAAPCNPSDLLLLQGLYGTKKTLPAVPGWEGAGIVVATGGGIFGRWLMGKRVAFSNQTESDGTWSEYCAVSAKSCIPLKEGVSTIQGASLIINPLTAIGLLDRAKAMGAKALIQTGAASQVGRMVLHLANQKQIPSIHIVRRKDQELLLKELGAKIILNSTSDNFLIDLKREANLLNATVAFEAVGGEMTGDIFNAMPNHSHVLVYGALSSASCSGLSPLALIFEHKTLHGFFLGEWIKSQGILKMFKQIKLAQNLIASGLFQTAIREEVSLEDAPNALVSYQKEMTKGKVIIRPHLF